MKEQFVFFYQPSISLKLLQVINKLSFDFLLEFLDEPKIKPIRTWALWALAFLHNFLYFLFPNAFHKLFHCCFTYMLKIHLLQGHLSLLSSFTKTIKMIKSDIFLNFEGHLLSSPLTSKDKISFDLLLLLIHPWKNLEMA